MLRTSTFPRMICASVEGRPSCQGRHSWRPWKARSQRMNDNATRRQNARPCRRRRRRQFQPQDQICLPILLDVLWPSPVGGQPLRRFETSLANNAVERLGMRRRRAPRGKRQELLNHIRPIGCECKSATLQSPPSACNPCPSVNPFLPAFLRSVRPQSCSLDLSNPPPYLIPFGLPRTQCTSQQTKTKRSQHTSASLHAFLLPSSWPPSLLPHPHCLPRFSRRVLNQDRIGRVALRKHPR